MSQDEYLKVNSRVKWFDGIRWWVGTVTIPARPGNDYYNDKTKVIFDDGDGPNYDYYPTAELVELDD